jgi:hypothetical protein
MNDEREPVVLSFFGERGVKINESGSTEYTESVRQVMRGRSERKRERERLWALAQ